MFTAIMVPLDGSETSRLAVPVAMRLASTARARLHFVQVHVTALDPLVLPAAGETEDESQREQERSALRALVAEAEANQVMATAELLEGPIARALERYAQAERVDLIVMTTHGRTGFARAVLGSTADAVVRRTFLPVLLLRPDAMPVNGCVHKFERVLVALDGSSRAERVIEHAVALTDAAGSLTLTRVVGHVGGASPHLGTPDPLEPAHEERAEAEEYLARLKQRLEQAPHPVKHAVVQRPSAARGILDAAAEQNADLIALSTRGHAGVTRALLGSVADEVVSGSVVPVLVVRPPRDAARPSPARLGIASIYF
jgi:nucleotide-binding universal stress UspA family protein